MSNKEWPELPDVTARVIGHRTAHVASRRQDPHGAPYTSSRGPAANIYRTANWPWTLIAVENMKNKWVCVKNNINMMESVHLNAG